MLIAVNSKYDQYQDNRLNTLQTSILVLHHSQNVDSEVAEMIQIAQQRNVDTPIIGIELEIFADANKDKVVNQNTCTSVDQTSNMPPVRSQGSIGWCYAHAAAGLIAHKTGVDVSANAIAVNYNQTHENQYLIDIGPIKYGYIGQSNIEGGYINQAIVASHANGYCLEEDFSTELPDSEQANFEAEIDRLEALYEEYTGYFGTSWGGNQDILECLNQNQPTYLFPSVTINVLEAILKQSSRDEFVYNLMQEQCQEVEINQAIRPHRIDAPAISNKKNLINKIDEQLNKGSIAAVQYDSDMLYNHKISTSLSHASTIIGRRFNDSTGECEYLLRNSWGDRCAYDPLECNQGDLWIPKSRLMGGALAVNYLE